MLFADGTLGLIVLVLWLFCIFDVITTDAGAVRNLPKLVWLFIVIVLFDIGSILWLIAGRPWQSKASNLPYKGNTGRYPEYDRPGRRVATNPDDDEAFLRGLRERAEEQRRAQRNRSADERPDERRSGDTEDGSGK